MTTGGVFQWNEVLINRCAVPMFHDTVFGSRAGAALVSEVSRISKAETFTSNTAGVAVAVSVKRECATSTLAHKTSHPLVETKD
ncbi:hypothetical protein BaRGS_00002962 [Batillaria attramentaria]|uniref:Uncharacterized protein n=1 Tax=Batillaria attramentaria TaxID=370345 RepID=A0ABD0M1U1_9CAEN